MTQTNSSIEQTPATENRLAKVGWERDGLRVWDQQMQISIYRMINNQILLYIAQGTIFNIL